MGQQMIEAEAPDAGTAGPQAGRSPLARLLRSATIAFVGLSDNSHFCRLIYGPDGFHAVDALLLLRDPRG
jgi:hypothetical protein